MPTKVSNIKKWVKNEKYAKLTKYLSQSGHTLATSFDTPGSKDLPDTFPVLLLVVHYCKDDSSVLEQLTPYKDFSAHNTPTTGHNKDSALHFAAKKGKTALIQYMLDNDWVTVDQTNDFNRTALHIAIRYDQADACQLLLNHGADPMHQDSKHNETCIAWAFRYLSINCLTVLSQNCRRKLQAYCRTNSVNNMLKEYQREHLMGATNDPNNYKPGQIKDRYERINRLLNKLTEQPSTELDTIGSTLSRLEVRRRKLIEQFRKNELPYSQLLEQENDLIQKIKQYLANKAPLDDFVINDRRKTDFFNAYPDLKNQAINIRYEDYLAAAKLIATALGANKAQLDRLQERYKNLLNINPQKHNSPEFLSDIADFINKLLRTEKNQQVEASDLTRASHLSTWQRSLRGLITVTAHGGYLQVQVDFPVGKLSTEQLDTICLINSDSPPQWYLDLPTWEQQHWRSISSDRQQLALLVNATQPVTNRCYPGLPFYLHHLFLLFDKHGKNLLYNSSTARSGTVDPYYLTNLDERETLVKQNLIEFLSIEIPYIIAKKIHEINDGFNKRKSPATKILVPILFQTLLSEHLDFF